jgi:hypothetical protein
MPVNAAGEREHRRATKYQYRSPVRARFRMAADSSFCARSRPDGQGSGR